MSGVDYRLLSEVEWEYAARGLTDHRSPATHYSWGNDDPVCQRSAPNGAAYAGCSGIALFPVGTFQPNRFGLFDVHGNLSEWVRDCRREEMALSSAGSAEGYCDANYRVVRGGSWLDEPALLRLSSRQSARTGDRPTSNDAWFIALDTVFTELKEYHGIRVARTL
jgi:formylglycine-generating enzyme required for sulfatase activity